jgi:hypothetical protein
VMVAFGTYAVVVTSHMWTLGVPTGFVPFVGFPSQKTSPHIYLTDSIDECDGR